MDAEPLDQVHRAPSFLRIIGMCAAVGLALGFILACLWPSP